VKFNVFFQANGVVVIDAESQAEAEAKAEDLSGKQIADAIDNVEILDVVKVEEKPESTGD
jgi:hypothetical protein